ncbi:MAG: OmpA family protein [Flavobacteriaceae bacterium]
MQKIISIKIVLLLLILPAGLFSQRSFEGVVSDLETGTELEKAMVIIKPLRISGAGYYGGKLTKADGKFKVSTDFDYPLQIVVSKKGCKSKIIKVKKDRGMTLYEIKLECEKETIDQIIKDKTSDIDKDGVLDLNDACPEVSGDAENEGCPWPDSDADGLVDKDDQCPEESGPESNQGCPITDQDSDGVNDEEDLCPTEAGSKVNKGCPDQPNSLVEIVKGKSIFFGFDSDQVKEEGDFFDRLATELKKYGYVALTVSGYASEEGPEVYNQKLSERRAHQVKVVLESKGIESTRIKSVGMGESDSKTDTSVLERKKNRRVIFSIQ